MSELQFNNWVDAYLGKWVSQWVKENIVCEGKRWEAGKVVLVPNFRLGYIVESYVNGRGTLQIDAEHGSEDFHSAAAAWQSRVEERSYIPRFYEDDDTDMSFT